MKILVTGPESTGKSTLSTWIAESYDMTLIPEHARSYLQKHGPDYTQDDLFKIAEEHFQIYSGLTDKPLLVFDTFILNIIIWSRFKFGNLDPRLKNFDSRINFDLVFLGAPDIPWISDPLRENPEDRHTLFNLFKEEIIQRGWPYHILVPGEEERKAQVKDILDGYLHQNLFT